MNRIATAVLASLLASSAFAAEQDASVASVVTQEGTVLVNQGEEFVTASEGQSLRVGDRVLVMEGGAAQVTFLDGCMLPLESGTMFTIPAISTCASNMASIERIGPTYAQALGDDDAAGNPSTLMVTFWVGTALITAGAMAGGDNDGGPVSP